MTAKETVLTIDGALDENCRLPENLNCETLVVDMDKLTLFNSSGVRAWVVWTRAQKGFRKLKLRNCRFKFINQAQYIADLIPKYAEVESFYVPFFNEATDTQIEVKFIFGKDFDATELKLPDVQGPNGEKLELDVLPKYFEFLRLKIPPSVK